MEMTKKIVIILIAAALLFPALQNSASAVEREMNFKVDGVTCLSIAYTAEAIPAKLDGVQSSKYDFAEDSINVVFEDTKVSIEDLKKSFAEENFPVVGEPVSLK